MKTAITFIMLGITLIVVGVFILADPMIWVKIAYSALILGWGFMVVGLIYLYEAIRDRHNEDLQRLNDHISYIGRNAEILKALMLYLYDADYENRASGTVEPAIEQMATASGEDLDGSFKCAANRIEDNEDTAHNLRLLLEHLGLEITDERSTFYPREIKKKE